MNQNHLIQSLQELEQRYGAPRKSSQRKIHDRLTQNMQRWLQLSPFFILSSYGAKGIDCSPRGDASGTAFRVIDQNTIAIPDRRGNNRIETLKNILLDPRVGLVFLIPGVEETMRIKGTASISIQNELLDEFALDGEIPATVILITITSAYVQNARAIRRSRLWQGNDSSARVPNARELYE